MNLHRVCSGTTERGNFQNSVPRGFIATQIHVFYANFVKFGRPEVAEIVRCLPHNNKQTKIASLSLSLLCGSRPKSARASGKRCTQECPKFHPNPFTFGGAIAERVNTVQTRHKVFPILGEASRRVTIPVVFIVRLYIVISTRPTT